MNLRDFTDGQIAFLCHAFHLTPNDLFYLSGEEVPGVYDRLCTMGDKMAEGIVAILDRQMRVEIVAVIDDKTAAELLAVMAAGSAAACTMV